MVRGGGETRGDRKRKRKSFRAVGFCRYTLLNGLATSGRQPVRAYKYLRPHTRVWAHTNMASGTTYIHTGRKLLPYLTINGACPETRPREFHPFTFHLLRTVCPPKPFQPIPFCVLSFSLCRAELPFRALRSTA